MTSTKPDGYVIAFTLRGVGSCVLHVGGQPLRFSRKADANKAAFDLVRLWRAGKGPAADAYRAEHRSQRQTGFSAVTDRPRVPNGRAWVLNVNAAPVAAVRVEQNLKEVN